MRQAVRWLAGASFHLAVYVACSALITLAAIGNI